MRSARRKGWNISRPACDRSSNGGSTLMTKWTGACSPRERKNSGSQSLPGQMRMERRRMTVWAICTHVSKNIGTTYVLKGACQLIFSHLYFAPVCWRHDFDPVWGSYCWEKLATTKHEWFSWFSPSNTSVGSHKVWGEGYKICWALL